ncbi:hypothetical protein SAMN05444156_3257 [Verrucomicrobium sp. GAS474]|uniref:hypothetical protein n=1 Tax=Verrucomicrobium sp. GAS474 TaxID=1882831 RepID=UPI00087965E8|nr:hypothetical protein [Verrucomicrobium sp. GAS474]SDT85690.1 hypothetical protein SAMN05444156_0019 [Verrucomicrobium sp. GAS474]SDU31705.1 hypothetical protein SAMN05444156_3257 [Verrucomicrobium sp. GAS474]
MNATTTTSAPVGPATRQFLEWCEKEKANGLVDIKFFATGVENTTVEGFLEEANKALSPKAAHVGAV